MEQDENNIVAAEQSNKCFGAQRPPPRRARSDSKLIGDYAGLIQEALDESQANPARKRCKSTDVNVSIA